MNMYDVVRMNNITAPRGWSNHVAGIFRIETAYIFDNMYIFDLHNVLIENVFLKSNSPFCKKVCFVCLNKSPLEKINVF